MSTNKQWLIWLIATIGLTGYLAYSLISQPHAVARTFLPGVTTHGHYQIELECHACHSEDLGAGVDNDACLRCHGDDLRNANDTHPKSKFTDPGLAHMVEALDGRTCLTCHKEHVPDQTLAMGLSLPTDYCWHCHDDVGEERPSHQGMAYDSCATAGCHNYHDNRALAEGFMVKHFGEPDMLEVARVPRRTLQGEWAEKHPELATLSEDDHDAPPGEPVDDAVLAGWASTAHAAAGVNCTACHQGDDGAWSDRLSHEACRECHDTPVETFFKGRHGMKLSVGLDPMIPAKARLPMNHEALHKELTCVACHGAHEFDTRFAAVDACLQCHNDEHSLAYKQSTHYELWLAEVSGESEAAASSASGEGVSCATCHMPREQDGDLVFVQHNQNDNLRPNEKMAKNACGHCHGLQFTLDALADDGLVRSNFQGRPAGRVKSVDMAKAWADERARLQEQRKRAREAKKKTQAGKQEEGKQPAV